MADIDLSNFRLVKTGNTDIERNYTNDILHAIVDKISNLPSGSGATGPAGPTGATGAAGSTGPTGATGTAEIYTIRRIAALRAY